MLSILLFAAVATAQPRAVEIPDRTAILANCYDNIDGQLEANVERVGRTLHPEFVARAVRSGSGRKPLELEIETREQLLEATRKGELKLPRGEWKRSCRIVAASGNVAVVRLETPSFVSFDELGKFDGRWVIVNSMWAYKPKP